MSGGRSPAPTSTSTSSPPSSAAEASSPAARAAQLLQLGAAAQQRSDQQGALDCYLRAIEARPDDWVGHTCAGTALKALDRLGEAIASHRRAVELGGDHRALSNLALAYRAAGRLDEAIATLQSAVARAPEVADLHGNLSGLLLAADRPAEAEAAARAAVALAPADARFETNVGYARKEQGDLAGGAEHLRRAIAHDPANADAHWNLGLTLLTAPASGDEERQGWAELEWRHQIAGLRVALTAESAAIPRWNGQALAGRRLLLQAEQGLGDTLQLARYARAAKQLGGAGEVILECQPALSALLTRCAGVDRIVARGASLPAVDVRAGLFSVPPWLGGRAATGANGEGGAPYLHADPARIRQWRARLDELTGGARFRVGIAWQGNRRYRADGRRSIPLASFQPLVRAARAAGAAVVSLQHGDGREQLGTLSADPRVIDLGPSLDAEGAFLDTAAVIAGLDLIVTSDTAIPHLAGALGAPVWLALAHLPDWRWGTAGESTDWYPTMRLFRQAEPGDWSAVFARIGAALAERLTAGQRGVAP
ncbi:MAG TPA: tetratricopeptide repeat protein [Polyangia bacterium]|nr:tetratricopeptide repeat protein [Polyangia bacterium]